MLTAKQAADQVGKSKATILKAIKTGRLSASKTHDGGWRIDPAELFRVYQSPPTAASDSALAHTSEHTELAAELAAIREKLAASEKERDRERHQLEETIADLRHRLDMEGEERRKLTALLTDQREKSHQKPSEGRLSRAWSILRGRS